jgi:hypothetical protein
MRFAHDPHLPKADRNGLPRNFYYTLFPTPYTLFFRCATIPVSVGAGEDWV